MPKIVKKKEEEEKQKADKGARAPLGRAIMRAARANNRLVCLRAGDQSSSVDELFCAHAHARAPLLRIS